jgi:hypothetical protein
LAFGEILCFGESHIISQYYDKVEIKVSAEGKYFCKALLFGDCLTLSMNQ